MNAAFWARGRAFLETRMGAEHLGSTATVRRKTGRIVQDEDTGRQSPVWLDLHTDLPCRISAATRGASPSHTIDRSDVQVEESARVISFPAATTGLVDGDLVDVTAGENAGLVFRIVEADWKDQATARRVPVIGEQRPKEWT